MPNRLNNLCELFLKLASSKEYLRQYMGNRYHSVRDGIIKELGGKCKSCGSRNDLQLDHIDKNKKTFRMSDAHAVSDARLKKEIKNVQLLCGDCHKEKTKDSWDFGTNKPTHGTYWMYRRHGCRCNKCVDAYKLKNKEWNTNRK